jgi:hypothetical protein
MVPTLSFCWEAVSGCDGGRRGGGKGAGRRRKKGRGGRRRLKEPEGSEGA